MKITRERKIIGSILALAAAAFGVDQLMGGPQAAEAGTGEPLLMATSDASNKSVASLSLTATGESLADRLARFASASSAPGVASMRDVFHPTTAWGGSSSTPSTPLDTQKFLQSHHLAAVSMKAQSGGVAIVDGKLMHRGSTLDGFKLESITLSGATFQNASGARVQLAVKSN